MKKRTVLVSLFAGIGGFDISARMMGWETIVTCEIDPWCRVVLGHHFPAAYHHDDIHTLTGKIINEEIEKRYGTRWRDTTRLVCCGGFPCQPYSAAGKRLGKDDDRHLWPEMLRVIQECGPGAVVGENVSGILSWNGGLVFEEVQADLEAQGFDVQAVVVPACAVGAPHRRDRVWFVANSRRPRTRNNCGPVGDEGWGAGENRGKKLRQTHRKAGTGWNNTASPDGESWIITHAEGIGHNGGEGTGNIGGRESLPDQPSEDAAIRGKLGGLGGLGQSPASPHPKNGNDWRGVGGKEKRQEPQLGSVLEQENVAYPQSPECELAGNTRGGRHGLADENLISNGDASHTTGKRTQGERTKGEQVAGAPPEEEIPGCDDTGGYHGFWDNFPTEWPLRDGDDGISERLGGICIPGTGKKVTASSLNKFTLKAGGNAIVPQVALQIFRALEATWENC